jgi:hypothetical protein
MLPHAILTVSQGRLFRQLARHLLFRRPQLTISASAHGAQALFAPVVTTSYTPLLDIDYNLHKSNSTFFNDLDDNRTELMLALFKNVVKPVKDGKETLKGKMFALGGTSCIFKKAIAPLARYEISSRVLCWDTKWVYVVSHFTKPGSNKPTHFLVGSQSNKPVSSSVKGDHGDQQDRIYATAITKYVFKAGRITCTPESVLGECGLLPAIGEREQVQKECTKHLEVAQNFGSLDALHGTFVGRSGPAMYTY